MKKNTSKMTNRTFYTGKSTKKDMSKIYDERFVVYGIRQDGTRASTYGNCNGIQLLEELVNQRNRTIVIPAEMQETFEKEFGYYGQDGKTRTDTNFAKNAEKYAVKFSFYR